MPTGNEGVKYEGKGGEGPTSSVMAGVGRPIESCPVDWFCGFSIPQT